MRVLVTGGAGFIGGNLCRRLLTVDEISEVVVLDDLSSGSLDNLAGLDVTTHVGSILDLDQLDASIDGCDAVVHLAAIPSVPRSLADPLRSHHATATGTLHVVDAARRRGDVHVIVAGSSSVYGSNPTLPKHEELAPAPMSPYAAAKLAAESYALAYAQSFKLAVLSFRFFNVYGPLQAAGHAYAAVIPAFVDAALRHQSLPVHGDGLQSRDFTYVDTVTAVIADAVRRRVHHDRPVNLAFGSNSTLREVIEGIEALIGQPLSIEHLAPRVGDVPHSQADSSSLRGLFPGIEPVPLKVGLAHTVRWMQQRFGADGESACAPSAAN